MSMKKCRLDSRRPSRWGGPCGRVNPTRVGESSAKAVLPINIAPAGWLFGRRSPTRLRRRRFRAPVGRSLRRLAEVKHHPLRSRRHIRSDRIGALHVREPSRMLKFAGLREVEGWKGLVSNSARRHRPARSAAVGQEPAERAAHRARDRAVGREMTCPSFRRGCPPRQHRCAHARARVRPCGSASERRGRAPPRRRPGASSRRPRRARPRRPRARRGRW